VTNDNGTPGLVPHGEQLGFHLLARVNVERAERLVHQHLAAAEDPVLGHRDALAHAAAQLRRIVRLEAGEAHARQPVVCESAGGTSGRPAEHWAQSDVVAHVLPRKQRILLKHVRGMRVEPGKFLPADADASRRSRQQPRGQIQQRRLATTAWTHDRHEGTSRDGQRNIFQGPIRLAVRRLKIAAHPVEFERDHRRRSAQPGSMDVADYMCS
jgi:hypothetical protein